MPKFCRVMAWFWGGIPFILIHNPHVFNVAQAANMAARPINAKPFKYSQPRAPQPTKNTSKNSPLQRIDFDVQKRFFLGMCVGFFSGFPNALLADHVHEVGTQNLKGLMIRSCQIGCQHKKKCPKRKLRRLRTAA